MASPHPAWLQSIWGSSSKQANFVIKNIFPYAHICQHKLEDKCFRLILCYWKCEADVSSPSGCALAAVVLNWILDTQLWGEWAKLTQMFLLNIFALFNLIIIVSQCRACWHQWGVKARSSDWYTAISMKNLKTDAFRVTPHARQRSRGGEGREGGRRGIKATTGAAGKVREGGDGGSGGWVWVHLPQEVICRRFSRPWTLLVKASKSVITVSDCSVSKSNPSAKNSVELMEKLIGNNVEL